MDFSDFKSNIAVTRVLVALDFGDELEAARSYNELKWRIDAVCREDDGWAEFKRRVDKFAGVCSSGEGVVLAAVLHFLGHDDLADQLDEGRTWRRMYKVSGPHLAAVGACIVQDLCPQ